MRTPKSRMLVFAMALLVASISALSSKAVSTMAQENTVIQAAAAPAGNVIQAASCSQTDVQAAVDAASDGDFVLVPAGSCTWTTLADYTPGVLISNKAITIQGAGIDRTIITDATNGTWLETPFWIVGAAGKPFRITGFTLKGTPGDLGVIYISGDCQNFRLDHLKFDGTDDRDISIVGKSYGVIDHCEFRQPRGQGVWIGDQRGNPQGLTSWEEPMSFGTADAVYIEDNIFIWGSDSGGIDCARGGRYTFRHNTVEGTVVGNHGMDSTTRSCLQMEIYDNTLDAASHSTFFAIQSRGGAAVVFNNTINGMYSIGIGVTNYRSCCYAGVDCSPHGQCDGANPIDGNTEPQEVYQGWPCKDQVGRGSQQSSYPVYEWNNTYNGSDVDVTVYNTWSGCTDLQPSDHIQENRDYYNDTPRPDYTPYVYPHPLARDIVLSGAPGNEIIQLDWSVAAWTYLPPTTTWQIAYQGPAGDQPSPVTLPLSSTRAYSLTGVTNHTWYTVTLYAMLGDTSWLSDTLQVMAGHTCVSEQNGDWGQVATWDCDAVPGAGDIVRVSSGTTVTVDASAQFYTLDVEHGATLVIPAGVTLTATGGVANQGKMQQARSVNNERVAFLEIGNGSGAIHYRGAEVDTPGSLGTVTVTLRALAEGESCTTRVDLPAHARRCFEIEASQAATASLRLWTLQSETSPTVIAPAIFRHSGGTWIELTDNTAVGVDGDYSYVQADTPGFSHFLIAQSGSTPTAISQRDLGAQAGRPPGELLVGLALTLAASLALGLRVLWQRRYR